MLQEDKLWEMFNFYDHDQSGTIDVEEFRDAFVGKQIASETWDEMIKEVDEDEPASQSTSPARVKQSSLERQKREEKPKWLSSTRQERRLQEEAVGAAGGRQEAGRRRRQAGGGRRQARGGRRGRQAGTPP